MGDYTPVYTGGAKPYSTTASAAVTGGTMAAVTGAGTMGTAGALSAVATGVFAHDAASGARVTVWPLDGCIHEIVAANGITAGGGVQTAASGQVDPATTSIATQAAAGTLIGVALTTATSGNKVRFQGRH